MNLRQPLITKEKLQAFRARAVFWALRLAAFLLRWIDPPESRALRRIVHREERFLGHVLFLTAVLRLRYVPRPQQRLSAPRGFRRTSGHIHLVIKSARIAKRDASIRARILNLLDVLANSERAIAHFTKRLRHGLCRLRLIATVPAAIALIAGDTGEVALADSS